MLSVAKKLSNSYDANYDVMESFFDDEITTSGNCSNRFHGLHDLRWWRERLIWGEEVRGNYNVECKPFGFIQGDGKFRRIIVRIVDHPKFDQIILTIIVLNSVTMTLDSAPSLRSRPGVEDFVAISEIIFLAAFTIEAFIKIIALGFISHRGAYLHSKWNQLDFTVVIISYIGLHPSIKNLSVIRSLRLLRPLRSISRIDGLKVLLAALVNSLPALLDVVMLLAFVLVVFSIGGVAIWSGTWHRRCYIDWMSLDEATDEYHAFFVQQSADKNITWGSPVVLRNITRTCSTMSTGLHCNVAENGIRLPQVCRSDSSVSEVDLINFDSVLNAILLVFKVISLDDWPEELQRAQDVSGIFAFLYFLAATLLGAYFCMNLVLAILASVFGQEASEQRSRKLRESKRINSTGPVLDIYPITIATCHSSLFRLAFTIFVAGKPKREVKELKRTSFTIAALLGRCQEWQRESELARIREKGLRLKARVRVVDSDTILHDVQTQTVGWHQRMSAVVGKVGIIVTDIDEENMSFGVSFGVSVFTMHHSVLHNKSSIVGSAAENEIQFLRRTFTQVTAVSAAIAIMELTNRTNVSTLTLVKLKIRRFVLSPTFTATIIVITVINALTMCMDHHGISDTFFSTLQNINWSCGVIFIIEAIVKVNVMGIRDYFYDRFNCFDFFLALLSIPEVISRGGGLLSIFRTFRIVRVLKLVRSWDTLQQILMAISKSLSAASSLFVIMLLFVFIYTILGLQLFSESTWPSSESNNFSTLWSAALTVFVVLTGDGWTSIMKAAMRTTTPAAAMYFVSLFWLGSYVFMNLFIAILIDTFSVETLRKHEQDVQAFQDAIEVGGDIDIATEESFRSERPLEKHGTCDSLMDNRNTDCSGTALNLTFDDPAANCVVEVSQETENNEQDFVLLGNSLYIFSPDNALRIACAKLVVTPQFENVIFVLIVINVISLCVYGPWMDDEEGLKLTLFVLEIVLVVLFCAEALLKIISFGLWKIDNKVAPAVTSDEAKAQHDNPRDESEERKPYLRTSWNRVDAFVVVSSLLGLFIPLFELFRCLRSLRLVIRNENVKVVVSALFRALPAIGNVVLVVGFIFLVFSVLGVQLFKGTFYSCTDSSIRYKIDCHGSYSAIMGYDIWSDPIYGIQPRRWINSPYHFDHIGAALLTLIEVSLTDGWARIMYGAIDSVSTTEGPRKNANPEHAVFFVMFVATASFFAINLFVGLLIDRFNDLKRKLDGSAFLTKEQQEWVHYNRTINKLKLRPVKPLPTNRLRLLIFNTVTHQYFESLVIFAILVNVGFMLTKHHGQSDKYTSVQRDANLFFVCAFGFEALLKIIAFDKRYFSDGWNRFDFSLVILSVAGLFINNSTIQVFRIFRVSRMIRLVKRARGLQKLFSTLLAALPSLLNISMLLLVTYFNFAVIGVRLFGKVRRVTYLTKWQNFENVGNAVLTLYTVATTELWADIMRETQRRDDGCNKTDSCGSDAALVYFPAFMIIGGLVIVNLVITVVLENFGEQETQQATRDVIEILRQFRGEWLKYDPMATESIHADHFIFILKSLPSPIGIDSPDSQLAVMIHIKKMAIVVSREGKLRYISAIQAMLRQTFNIRSEEIKFLQKFTTVQDHQDIKDSVICLHHYYAAKRIQTLWIQKFKSEGRRLPDNEVSSYDTN